jgi:hypothetical protein
MRDFGINDLRSIAPEGCTVIKLDDDSAERFAITFSDGSTLTGLDFDHAALALRDDDDDDDDTLTADDWAWLRECYASSIAECDSEGWEYEGEDVMTSIGYVGLSSDGDVVAFGRNLGNVND